MTLTLHNLNQMVLGLGANTPILARGPSGGLEEFQVRAEVLGLNDPASSVRIVLVAEAPNATQAFTRASGVDSAEAEAEAEQDANGEDSSSNEDSDSDDPDGNGEPGDQFDDLDK